MPESPRISLPKFWPTRVKSAMLHVISLAQFSMAYSRGWAADSVTPRLRLKARVDQLEQEVALLREEIRIKDVRMVSISPVRKSHCSGSAAKRFAYDTSWSGVSLAGSTVKLTMWILSGFRSRLIRSWTVLSKAVCRGHVAVQRVNMKLATQGLPARRADEKRPPF